MLRDASIVLRTYLATVRSARGFRGALLGLALLAVIPLFGRATFADLRAWIVSPATPLCALALSELSLRDGLRRRTLLYPLLGPISRPMLAVVRTLATAALAMALLVAALALMALLDPERAVDMPRQLAAVALGSFAYVGLFGAIHLVTARGIVAGLALYGLVDDPLGRIPLALRDLVPSSHLRSVAGIESSLPLPVEAPSTSVWVSVVVLLSIGALGTWSAAWLFSRRNLGDLC